MTTAVAEDRECVGPYRVIQAIGAGGSARIDLARIDRAYGFQRHVVIKRPLEHLRANPNVAASLRREARIGGQLRHPNLVAILDAGVHDGYDYLVIEYVHGAALRTVMETDAPGRVRELPLAVTLAIVTDVARGMHEAHELTDDRGAPLGLVHRDVSPGNILLGLDGTVKLADFGIAKETRISTLSGSMHGTVTYMAPEQCQGHAFDRRADVFSLGVILYELVTGTRLFWADNDVASLHRVLSGAVPRPRKLRPQLPSALEDIILIAVAHDAGERFPTALELAGALEAYAAQAGEVIGARWIARTMEDVIGARQVPWIAAATAPEAGPSGDGSLVDLIAAAEPDEPASTSFGDADDAPAAANEPPGRALGEPPGHELSEPPGHALSKPQSQVASEPQSQALGERPSEAPSASSGARTELAPRRRRTLLAAVVALGVVGGSAAVALGVLRSSSPPAANLAPAPTALSTATPGARGMVPTAPETSPASHAASRAPQPTSEPPSPSAARAPAASPPQPSATRDLAAASPPVPSATRAPAADPPRAAPAPADIAASTVPPTGVAKKRRPPRSTRPVPRAAIEATSSAHEAGKSDTAAPSAPGGPGSGAAQPAARPPVNVEWKPTLLLPTDGSDARPPK